MVAGCLFGRGEVGGDGAGRALQRFEVRERHVGAIGHRAATAAQAQSALRGRRGGLRPTTLVDAPGEPDGYRGCVFCIAGRFVRIYSLLGNSARLLDLPVDRKRSRKLLAQRSVRGVVRTSRCRGAAIGVLGVAVRIARQRAIAGELVGGAGPFAIAGGVPVVSKVDRIGVALSLQAFRYFAMNGLRLKCEELVVKDLPRNCVAEGENSGGLASLSHQLKIARASERARRVGIGDCGDPREKRHVEAAADHRRIEQDAALLPCEPFKPVEYARADAQRRVNERTFGRDHGAVDELFGEVRLALGQLADACDGAVRIRGMGRPNARDQTPHLVRVERWHGDRGGALALQSIQRFAPPVIELELLRANGSEKQPPAGTLRP